MIAIVMKIRFTILLFALALVPSCASAAEASPGTADASVTTADITLNPLDRDQTMEGFGVYGGRIANWHQYFGPELGHLLVDELGITISRGPLPFDFQRGDGSINTTGDISQWIPVWQQLRARGVGKFIISVWSPPVGMKDPGTHGHFEFWCRDGRAGGRLLPANYPEFADMCVNFLRYFKARVGIEVYGLSLQNEPAFDEPYESCLYTPQEYVDLVKVVGPRIRAAGLSTQLFGPEDIGSPDRVMSYLNALMADPEACRYLGFVAVHGYAANGITADSPDAKIWQAMYAAGAAHGKPLWMTETSGFGQSWPDAMSLARAIYTSLRFGHVSGWCWWQAATGDDHVAATQALISGPGGMVPQPTFCAVRNFACFVRPGDVRIASNSNDPAILPLAFKNDASHIVTVIVINQSDRPESINVKVGLPSGAWRAYRSSARENCVDVGILPASAPILVPPQSLTTLLCHVRG
jgi:glucuronoarabinoxylan endo-1,4-beta-xylanase